MIGYGGIEKVFEEEIKEATDRVKKETTAKVEKETAERVERELKRPFIEAAKKLLSFGVSLDILYNCFDHDIIDQAIQSKD